MNLATAFETLLTDQYERGVGERLQRRVRLIMPAKRRRHAEKTLERLYEVRSLVVHHGTPEQFDIRSAQELFARVFIRMTERLKTWVPSGTQPITELVGDT